jgi:hypothetical protein
MRMEVQPAALTDAGTRQSDIAGQLTELSGRLTTAADAASAAGDPAVEEAMTGAVQSWQASLAMVSHSVGSIGSNLGSASIAYLTVDESAIPAG